MPSFGFAPPPGHRYLVDSARVPACLLDGLRVEPVEDDLCAVDIVIDGASIEQIAPAGSLRGISVVQQVSAASGCVVLPCPVDVHTHLDKSHTWPRRPNPDGTFNGALQAVGEDRERHWSRADLSARMDFSLRAAYAHGTCAVRTHLDSIGSQAATSWAVFDELRERWAGRIDLQGVSLVGIERVAEDEFAREVVPRTKRHGGLLGAVTYPTENIDALLRTLFEAALANDLALDLHCDESGDAGADTLRRVAEIAIATEFPHPILVGHCCSLAVQSETEALHTLDRVAAANISMVSLPMCNLYLQARGAGTTPRWRGLTLVHEARARGIDVCFASDNTRDPFYAYGDMDMLEVFREATRIAHLDHPPCGWVAAVSRTPAAVMGLNAAGRLRAGGPADFLAFRARRYTELLSRPQADRTVVRGGQAVDTALPDYAELDALLAD